MRIRPSPVFGSFILELELFDQLNGLTQFGTGLEMGLPGEAFSPVFER